MSACDCLECKFRRADRTVSRTILAHHVSSETPVVVDTATSTVPYPVSIVGDDGRISLTRAGAFELVHALLDVLEVTR